jgi:hypothetical protein
MVTIAHTEADVELFLKRLGDPDRARPIVVVTTLFESGEPLIDVAALDADADAEDVADVVLVASGDLSYQLAAGLPPIARPSTVPCAAFPPATNECCAPRSLDADSP